MNGRSLVLNEPTGWRLTRKLKQWQWGETVVGTIVTVVTIVTVLIEVTIVNAVTVMTVLTEVT